MRKKYCKQISSVDARLTLIAVAAIFAGFVNGFLGTGGGIILIFALTLAKIDERDKFATVIAAILPMTLISAFFYKVKIESAANFLLPGMLGGAAGAFLLDKISLKWLKKLFALMVIWAGICFVR